jgi:hypothetical protein
VESRSDLIIELLFNFSTEKVGHFLMFSLKFGKNIPVGKTLALTAAGILVYVAWNGIKEYGVKKEWAAFKKELTKIIEKYPCLGDANGNPAWITPGEESGEYIIKDKNEVSYPAIWKEDVLYFIDKRTKKITQPVSC